MIASCCQDCYRRCAAASSKSMNHTNFRRSDQPFLVLLNLPGVIAVGFGMGVLEQFGGFIIGAAYQQAIVVGVLLAVLVVRLILQSRKRQVME